MNQNSQIKFNDEEMAKHAKCFNQLCAKIILLVFGGIQIF